MSGGALGLSGGFPGGAETLGGPLVRLFAPAPPATSIDLRQGLVALVRADAALAALVGRRLYPDALPQGVALPALSYAVLSDRALRDLDGKTGLREARLEVTCYAARKSGCVELAAAVDSRLDPGTPGAPDRDWGGVTVRWCHQEEEQDVSEPVQDGSDARRWLLPVSYQVNYRE